MIINYEEILLENLRNLMRKKTIYLIPKYLVFEENWIKKRKCLCVLKLRDGLTINCGHYENARKIKFKKEIQEVEKLGTVIMSLSLYLNPKSREYFSNGWQV